ncbi:hypothetical protein [Shimazuella soli]|uniref:hypothetical protein n=1 Tax=Shimazuella soli TaxID=1892854 RepID=UPI001F11455B|nr:hypothetical protein [Shimazuella soli]
MCNKKPVYFDCLECNRKKCVQVNDAGKGFCNTSGCINVEDVQYVFYPHYTEPKVSRWGRVFYDDSISVYVTEEDEEVEAIG